MQINLEKRKNTKFKENEVHLNLVLSNSNRHLLVGCPNLGYHAYNIDNTNNYSYANKINLKLLHDGVMFYNVKVKYNETETLLSFFSNQNQLLLNVDTKNSTINFDEFSTDNTSEFSLSILEEHHQYFDFYGIVDDKYFKLDDVVYQLVKNNAEFDSLFLLEDNEEYNDDLYDSAFIIKAINPPIDKFPEKPIDSVQIKRYENISKEESITGTNIYSKKKRHSYVFAGQLKYEGEDCSISSYFVNGEVEKKKKNSQYKMSDDYWNYLTNFSDNTIGLKEGTAYGSAWINEIITRLNEIDDNEVAIRKMFAIQQKIGMAKINTSYSYKEKYPLKLYKNLENTLSILLKQRFNK